jgi:hypothetical protein
MNTQTKAPEKAVKSIGMIEGANKETTAKTDRKEELNKLVEKFKPEPPRTAEDRINSLSAFEALTQRYRMLKDKEAELKKFHAGNDKTTAKIVFKNSQGFEFSIQNSNVIEKLTKSAQEELSILLNEAENEVLTFQI